MKSSRNALEEVKGHMELTVFTVGFHKHKLTAKLLQELLDVCVSRAGDRQLEDPPPPPTALSGTDANSLGRFTLKSQLFFF